MKSIITIKIEASVYLDKESKERRDNHAEVEEWDRLRTLENEIGRGCECEQKPKTESFRWKVNIKCQFRA